MVQPVSNETLEQVRTPQKRTVGWRTAAKREVIAAARSRVPAIEHELLRPQAALARLFIKLHGVVHKLAPVRCRMDVDLDHSRIRSHFDHAEAGIIRRRVAFDKNRHRERGRRVFNGHDEFDVIFGRTDRGHEYPQAAIPRLDSQRGAHDIATERAGFSYRSRDCLHPPLRARGNRQRCRGSHRIQDPHLRNLFGRLPWQAVQWKPKSNRRIAREQKQMPRAQHPQAGLPFGSVLALASLDRQDEANRLSETAFKNAPKTLTFLRVVELVVLRIDIDWKLALLA